MAKKTNIKYTARDFETIKGELVEYSKRYYPDTYKDFTKASFGSLMLDTVSYVGDVLSFYLDYQFNESFLTTATEFNNIIKIANQMGYKYNPKSTAFGFVELYISVPASSEPIGPNLVYLPILSKGSTFTSNSGLTFTLLEDVDFSTSTNEIVVANVDNDTGQPTTYAVKTVGIVQSGFYTRKVIEIGPFERFKKVEINDENVLEIVSVTDSEGNEYYEVDNLSQDVIYREVPNTDFQNDGVASLLKPFPVPRRFVIDKTPTNTTIQFGYGSEDEITSNSVAESSQLILQMHAKNYFSDNAFDPTNLIKSDKFGVSPSNTNLTIVYRKANNTASNVPAGAITNVGVPSFVYPQRELTNSNLRSSVNNSLEVFNTSPLTGEIRLNETEELRLNAINNFSSQKRAVTKQDYQSLIYNIPSKFGKVKRCFVSQDNNSFKRNLNIYVVSQGNDGNLMLTNDVIKNNLKTWISQYKMINDTVDILDSIIINFGIEFNVIADVGYDRTTVLNVAKVAVQQAMLQKMEIGEPISVAKIYNILNKLDGVLDTTNVNIIQKNGFGYSSVNLDLEKLKTFDGKYVRAPKNVIYEVKNPAIDIKGTVT